MIDWLLNLFFGSYWDRSKDPLLDEIRGYQRGMVIFGGVTIVLVLASFFFQPDSTPATGLATITNQIYGYFYFGVMVALLICTLATLYFAVRYLLFYRKYGADE